MRTDKTTLYVIGGAVALVYFGVLDPILTALGIKKDQDDRSLDVQAQDPGSPWAPTMWKQVSGAIILTNAAAVKFTDELYNAFGAFNDCEECVKAVFRQLKFKTQVSYLADVFYQRYGQDLLAYLRGGNWPQDRLSSADLAEINSFIQKLPLK